MALLHNQEDFPSQDLFNNRNMQRLKKGHRHEIEQYYLAFAGN